jgi:hypothetical protein
VHIALFPREKEIKLFKFPQELSNVEQVIQAMILIMLRGVIMLDFVIHDNLEEYYLLGCNAVWFGRSLPTF